MADHNRHLRQNGAPECGQGPRQQRCRGEGLSAILHIQQRPDSRGIYEGLTISTASKQHLVNIWLQGTELVGFLQDESSTPDGMWGVCVGGKYLNTHGNVSVKEILKLRKQSLAREYWNTGSRKIQHTICPQRSFPPGIALPRSQHNGLTPSLWTDAHTNLFIYCHSIFYFESYGYLHL